MSITSFWFLIFISASVLFYYICPHRFKWIELLLASIVFYLLAGTPITIFYLLTDTIIAYVATMVMLKCRQKEKKSKIPFVLCVIAIILISGIWFVVKGTDLWMPLISIFSSSVIDIEGFSIIAALGMGYFTLQILGYVIDSYWEVIEIQTNPFKLLLFVIYFPQLITGPISRYSQLKNIYDKHTFNYNNICMGAQRILWGFFKKLVLADRIGIITSGINNDPINYYGFYSVLLLLVYPLEMYCDFSGCMDIVLGVSELFGINLPENFNNPFFSKSSQEFWQRWHMTLGSWAKDYVLFPLQKSIFMSKIGKGLRYKFGKKTGNFVKNSICMFFLWMIMGIWHGGYRYIVGVSLWYWIILMSGNILQPLGEKLTAVLDIKIHSFSWRLFGAIRTYIIYAVGALFFSNDIKKAIYYLKDCLCVIFVRNYANPWVIFNDSILGLGITYRDVNILFIGILLLLAVGCLREKYSYARIWIKNQSFVFRWMIWIGLFVFVSIYGGYGPDFDAKDFIYQGF